jgi:hypothetical protein
VRRATGRRSGDFRGIFPRAAGRREIDDCHYRRVGLARDLCERAEGAARKDRTGDDHTGHKHSAGFSLTRRVTWRLAPR